jgi:hypothetical protein
LNLGPLGYEWQSAVHSFPLFKLRRDPRSPGGGGAVSLYRDSHHATGMATSWSNRREGTLEVNVRAPERDPTPDRSPWEGMSGAPVFGGGCLIGVIGEHHRSDGLDTLAAYPTDRWYELDDVQLDGIVALIGLPATLAGLVQVAAGQPDAGGAPHQLPATTQAFVGREHELAALLELAGTTRAVASPGTVVISAIDGMAGVGKSALAIHAGHLLVDRFPDGQLFLDLYGFTQDDPFAVNDSFAFLSAALRHVIER